MEQFESESSDCTASTVPSQRMFTLHGGVVIMSEMIFVVDLSVRKIKIKKIGRADVLFILKTKHTQTETRKGNKKKPKKLLVNI